MKKNKIVLIEYMFRHLIACVSIVAIVCVSFGTEEGLVGEFGFDDHKAITGNADCTPKYSTLWEELVHADGSWGSLWVHDFWGQDISKDDSHKSYRPLTVISFRLNRLFSESDDDTFSFHIFNYALHGICSVMVYFLVLRLFSSDLGAFKVWMTAMASGMIFAIHPVHVEAVTSIVGRSEPLCLIFCILCFLSYTKWVSLESFSSVSPGITVFWVAVTFFMYALAVLSKETGVTVLGLLLSWDLLQLTPVISPMPQASSRPRLPHTRLPKPHCRFWRRVQDELSIRNPMTILLKDRPLRPLLSRTAMLFLWGAMYLMLRKGLTGHVANVPNNRHLENPIAFIGSEYDRDITADFTLFRALNIAMLHCEYFRVLVYPERLSCDWSYDCIPLVTRYGDPRNLRSVMLYVGMMTFVFVAFGSIGKTRRVAPKKNQCPQAEKLEESGTAETSAEEHLKIKLCPGKPSMSLLTSTSTGCNARGDLLALAWLIVPFLPASNVFFFVGTMLAERLLYIPSVGFCILCARLLGALLPDEPRRLSSLHNSKETSTVRNHNFWLPHSVVGLFLYIVAMSVIAKYMVERTQLRTKDWADEGTLFLKALETCPRSAKVHQNVGILYRRSFEWDKALYHFNMAKKY
eukprot:Rmarinus@m.20341